tara:strand:- start:217 stop:1020 length:804 start_codon:yes stop_codon:yes gene_type:complete
MTIHIYSDSFGEMYAPGAWPAELEKLQGQEVICNGQGGTGPNWSLRKLIRHLEDLSFKSQDTIIVLLSDQKRMEFPWLEKEGHADGLFLLAENISSTVLSKFNPTRGGQYVTYNSEIKTVANTLGPMHLYENVKNLTFLHLLSKQFKNFNFLVFTCFSLDHFTSKYKNFNIKSTKLLHDLDFEYLNTPNFYYVSTPISYMVGKHKGSENDIHYNHMTVEQNKKFALFCDAILNKEDPDSSWFVYTAFNDKFAKHQGSEPPPPTFIYE